MKLDLNKPITGLDEKSIDPVTTLGKVLSQQLANSTTGDPVKYLDWALALYKGEPVEIDAADTDTLKTFIKSSAQMTNLAKAQLLKAMVE